MPENSERPDESADPAGGLPPEMLNALRRLTGGADLPPELLQQLETMGLGGIPVEQFEGMLAQFQSMFAGPDEGPLSPSIATDVARQLIAAQGDASMGEREASLAREAAHVADLWLGQVSDLEAPGLQGVAWSRSEWIEDTFPVWQEVVSPVAIGVSRALTRAMSAQFADGGLEGIQGMLPPGTNPAAAMAQIGPMLDRAGASMFSMQLGQGLAGLAGETLTGTEVSLPLTSRHLVALIPANIAAFADGLEIDLEQVWLYLAVREAARLRLFAGVPWLGPQILTAVQDYARDIAIDTEAIDAAMQGLDPADPQAMQQTMADKLFSPTPTPAQQAALSRLETWLALVEGWVDVVTERAAGAHLPQASALGETMRRRRATGGPAEKTFASLVGLELRPRRLRDAANLFAALEDKGGSALRDSAWGHPDIAPTAADLDDVLAYVERRTAVPEPDSMDDALRELLDGASE
ncbi:zinc-dependent metalloprotease [Nostocoides sp.]|uniref:zinc-dependent metalloprotease n=1 Tax=Nostocoides sp. TaxID=1917966 RepID=UPI002BC7AA07|nr:zinc-dependent metalloprotease [Tetrasphaera sp.]